MSNWSNDTVPAPLSAGVNWWLSQPGHEEDVVALTEDGQDAMILTGNVDAMVWVNPDGTVRVARARFDLVHTEEEEVEL